MVENILVGTASVNWGFDPLYTWVKQPAFADMLDQMSVAGYAGTEISYNFPAQTSLVREFLSERSLRAAASFVALDFRDRALHKEQLGLLDPIADRLQALSSNTMILSDKPSPERIAIAGRVSPDGIAALDERAWAAMCDGFNRAAAQLAARGMKAVFHPHAGTYVETRSEIDRLCASTDASLLGLCPDTGHLAYAGVNVDELFSDYASRISYVHLKDVDADKLAQVRAEGVDFVTAVRMGLFVELGAGIVPIARIVATLRASQYAGWLVVEQDAPRNPLEAAQKNRAYLLAECGL